MLTLKSKNKMLFKSDRASLSIEVAVTSTMLSFVFFFFMSLLQYVYVYFSVSETVIDAAEKFSCYSSVLHKSGLDSLSENVKGRLLQKTGIYDNEKLLPLVSVADTAFELIDTVAYNAAIKSFISSTLNDKYEHKKSVFTVEEIELLDSSYFENSNEFKLVVSCKTKFILPVPFFKADGYCIKVSVKGNCWLSGNVSSYNLEDIKVWELSNFKRGRVLEKIFGANLPDDFPVIDIYNETEKTVTVIRSIDHTKKEYLKRGGLEKEIGKLAEELIAFNGAESGNINITRSDFKEKRLLIIMPTNAQTGAQSMEIAKVCAFYSLDGIVIKFEYYQSSNNT